jgi:hypothetical protein
MAKQTRVTIETDSLLILRSGGALRAMCPECAAEVEVIALENAGVVSNLDRNGLEEWLNSKERHRPQSTDGTTLLCLNSLLALVRNNRPQ